MGKFIKGQFVTYTAKANIIKALVQRVHRDGSYTVQAYFYVGSDGKDVPGFLGFRYRLSGSDLQAAA